MMHLIPAIDLYKDQCVRLRQGDFSKITVYRKTPVETAKEFESLGITHLHLVDLEGARSGSPRHLAVLRRLAAETGLTIDFSGGIRKRETLEKALEAGASKVCIGSLAVKNPELFYRWLDEYGPDTLILAADVKNGFVATSGWQKESALPLEEMLTEYRRRGGKQLMVTDIGRDGTLSGPATELYRTIRKAFPQLELTASGGVGKMADIHELQKAGLSATILGKAWYEGKVSGKEILEFTGAAKKPASELTKRIIPCLDVKDGRTVKGIHFQGLRDAGDPVELAKKYSQEGADELVFLDITATNEKRKTLAELVRQVATTINIPFTVGGGIGSVEEVQVLLESGADKVSVNSAAVRDPELISRLSRQFGAQCIVLAVDARYSGEKWEVYTHGGRKPAGRELYSWIREAVDRGAGEVLFTSMDHDGTKKGFANEALSRISEEVRIPLIASGGAGSKEHFRNVFTVGKADAALAASVFHYDEIRIPELKQYLAENRVKVRL